MSHRNLAILAACLLVPVCVGLSQSIVTAIGTLGVYRTDTLLYDPAPYAFPAPSVVSVELVAGKMEVTYRQPSNQFYLDSSGTQAPASVWKDVYCARDGQVVFERRVSGRVVPEQTTPERIEWPAEQGAK